MTHTVSSNLLLDSPRPMSVHCLYEMKTRAILFVLVVVPLLVSADASSSWNNAESQRRRSTQTRNFVTVEQVTEPVIHAEGPHWDTRSQKLYFVDIQAQKLYRYNPSTEEVTYVFIKNGPVGVAVPVEDSPNEFVAGSGTDLVLVTWDGETNSTNPILRNLTRVDQDRSDTRFNDGKVDSHGRFWAGTMGAEIDNIVTPDQGSLYLIGDDLNPVIEIRPVNISNGLAWNKEDNKLYYIDTPTLQIASYDFDAEKATISNRKVAFDLAKHNISGVPDGMTIDTDGNLWFATFNGGHVVNVDPRTGEFRRRIKIPADKVTSVMFGDLDLDVLYVTTSRVGLEDSELQHQPQAGSVFAIKGLGVQGLPANSFHMKDTGF